MTLFPFVLVKYDRDKENRIFLNHEKIHLRQQLEMLIIPFFIWYFLEFVIRFIKCKDKDVAYRNISFEREAYKNERNFNYLKKRPFFRSLHYLTLKQK
ncbi:MAG: hypothetical protein EOO44_12165 [Flavobacterium sp.]|nr:MAG: hypothetical protein EOO44_12165 [Flavobacterium sp.]